MTASLTDEERSHMEHALGISQTGRSYRNHFMTGPGSTDWDCIQGLVDKGLMEDNGTVVWCAGDHCFTVTDAGRAALTAEPRT